MKTLLLSAAAAASFAYVVPALAQDAQPSSPERQMEVHRGMMAMHPMTRDAVARMVQDHFAAMDANKDGFVTRQEMDSAREQRRSKMVTRVQQRRGDHDAPVADRGAMFDQLDANHDGTITRDEFMSAKPVVREKRVIVMNGGGDADGHTGMGMRMHRMGMGIRFGGHMFDTADANKDGKVSLQEATSAALAHFDAADSNRDGTLSPDEMRAAHRAMRSGGKS